MRFALLLILITINCIGKDLLENKKTCNKNAHSLEIVFLANFNFTLENVKIKLSKKIPVVQYSTRFSPRSAIIVPFITKDRIPIEPVPSTDISAELHLKTFSTGEQIAECAKIAIKKDTVSKIFIFVKERELQSFWTFYGKLFPGIFILATFTNFAGHYYKREYRIQSKLGE